MSIKQNLTRSRVLYVLFGIIVLLFLYRDNIQDAVRPLVLLGLYFLAILLLPKLLPLWLGLFMFTTMAFQNFFETPFPLEIILKKALFSVVASLLV